MMKVSSSFMPDIFAPGFQSSDKLLHGSGRCHLTFEKPLNGGATERLFEL